MKKNAVFATILIIFFSMNLKAQSESNFGVHVGTDIASSYIWRGLESSSALNIQPTLEFSFGNFFAGFWGSYAINGSYQEPDLYFGYGNDYFSLTLNDYHLNGGIDYFDLDNSTTMHAMDAALVINGPEVFPIQITASSMIWGADKKIESIDSLGNVIYADKNNYSSYLELAYPFAVSEVNLMLSLGFVPMESDFYGTENPALINISLGASKEISITENFALPISFTVTANPTSQQMFFVLMLSL